MRVLAIVALLISASSCAAGAEVERLSLKNGLMVILKPVPESKHVALVVLFDMGGDHDPDGQSGLAHMMEHVYVTAAAGNAKARTVQEYVAAYPDGWNAQTGDRHTVVATVFEPGRLDAELQDAADRMQRLRVTDADLEREKPRIRDELVNMYGGIPQIGAGNLAREIVRPNVKGHRKGGVFDQVATLSADHVHAWWQKYYKPNNAVLVLAGSFDAAEAKDKVRNRFSQIERGDSPPELREPLRADIAATPSRVKVKPVVKDAKSRVCLAYAAPDNSDRSFPAFLVLVAKMQARAVELQSNPQVFPVQYNAIDDPRVLYVAADLRGGETPEEAIERLDAFVNKVVSERISKNDLEFANNAFAFFYGLAELPAVAEAGNVYGVAFTLGRREQLGIDSKRLAGAMLRVDQAAANRCRDRIFDQQRRAAIVVIPE